jgi:hypothetical protein
MTLRYRYDQVGLAVEQEHDRTVPGASVDVVHAQRVHALGPYRHVVGLERVVDEPGETLVRGA